MKKPSLADALAQKPAAVPPPASAETAPPAASPAEKPKDGRITTSLRIAPAQLEGLKIVAARKRVKVNDLLLEGVEHILALNGHKPD